MAVFCIKTWWKALTISLMCMLSLAQHTVSVAVAIESEQATQQSIQSQSIDLIIPSFFSQRLDYIHTLFNSQQRVQAYTSLIKTVYVCSDLPTTLRLHLFNLIEQDLLLYMTKDTIDIKGIAQIYRFLQDVRHKVTKKKPLSSTCKKWFLGMVIAGALIGVCAWLREDKSEENERRVEAENETGNQSGQQVEIEEDFYTESEEDKQVQKGWLAGEFETPLSFLNKQSFLVGMLLEHSNREKEKITIYEKHFLDKDVQSIEDDQQAVEGNYWIVIEEDIPRVSSHSSSSSKIYGLDEDEEPGIPINEHVPLRVRVEGNKLYIPKSWAKNYKIIGTKYFRKLLTTRLGPDGQKNKEICLSKLVANERMFRNFGRYIHNSINLHKSEQYIKRDFLVFGEDSHSYDPSYFQGSVFEILNKEIDEMEEAELVRMMFLAQELLLFELYMHTERCYCRKYGSLFKENRLNGKIIRKVTLLEHFIRKKFINRGLIFDLCRQYNNQYIRKMMQQE